jgi:ABC-type transport system involved in multi-copper enzyme maturation permease subunit
MLVSMLGTFLWTTPAISAELERRSWVYLAVRPNGGTAVLLGKYLAAVTWVIPPALVGLSIAVPLAATGDGWRLWWTMVRLVCLSCPAYGAVYLLLGTLLPRRAMVLAVAYTLIFEFIISFIPAVINRITVQHRSRSLLVEWCDLPGLAGRSSASLILTPDTPAWQHVTILLLFAPVLLALSVAVLRWSEFSASAESDV